MDNSYVSRKLKLLLFPFLHSDWWDYSSFFVTGKGNMVWVKVKINFFFTFSWPLPYISINSGQSGTATMNQFNQDLNSTLQTSTFQGMDNVCCWFGGWNWFKNWLEICFSMAFVTYILVVGYVLGMQDRFSPEVRLWSYCMDDIEIRKLYGANKNTSLEGACNHCL